MPSSVLTPDVVETRIGALRFADGIPDEDTCDRLFDNLELTHGVGAYLAGLPGVSARAIRQGFLDAGVADNTVLLYSGLMDSASLFLTGNADTVYFWSFLVGENTLAQALQRAQLKADKQVAKELDVSVGDIDSAVQQAATEVR